METEDGLPNMEAMPHETAKQIKMRENNFRAREKDELDDAENEGLPSVNRRKNDNKLVTIFGFIFIIGAAGALIVAVNSDKTPQKKNKNIQAEITNNLPALSFPAPAPPPPAVISVAEPTAQPIQLQASGNKPQPLKDANGKPIQDWTDRKMGGILLVSQQNNGEAASTGNSAHPVNVGSDNARSTADANNNMNGDKNELAAKLEPTITKGVSASMLPNRNFLLTKGTTLDCALETALDSSLPGLTTCRLTRDIYSDDGQVLLLDKGSQLVGEYQGGIKQGQVRVFVLWTRAKTPNGVVVSLNSPGTDALGRSGLDGWVDSHFAERFGAAILMSFVKDSVSAFANQRSSGAGTGGISNVYANSGNGGEKVVEKILESTVNIANTIIKNQGEEIQVMVARDLDFSSVYDLKVTE